MGTVLKQGEWGLAGELISIMRMFASEKCEMVAIRTYICRWLRRNPNVLTENFLSFLRYMDFHYHSGVLMTGDTLAYMMMITQLDTLFNHRLFEYYQQCKGCDYMDSAAQELEKSDPDERSNHSNPNTGQNGGPNP